MVPAEARRGHCTAAAATSAAFIHSFIHLGNVRLSENNLPQVGSFLPCESLGLNPAPQPGWQVPLCLLLTFINLVFEIILM